MAGVALDCVVRPLPLLPSRQQLTLAAALQLGLGFVGRRIQPPRLALFLPRRYGVCLIRPEKASRVS